MVKTEVVRAEPILHQEKTDEFKRGKRPDGSLIGTYSNLGYATDKYKQNSLAGFPNVDLIKTGAFVGSWRLLPKPNGLFSGIFTDGKTASLLQKYDNGNTGQKSIKNIDQNAFNKIQKEIIKPNFFREIKRQIGQPV